MSRVAVVGAGSWGTALALHLADRAGHEVVLWARRAETAGTIERARENSVYLPGHRLPPALGVTADLGAALKGAAFVFFVTPVQASRAVYRQAIGHLEPGADLVIASKGIEEGSLSRPSEILEGELVAARAGAGAGEPGRFRVCVVSGPSFALEVARGDPAAVVVASADQEAAGRVQEALSAGALRAYRNADVAGVELAGALKNVVAIATGIAEGIGFGANTRAALITRGLAEIARLGTTLGGRSATFAGLAGMGDLVLTCTGVLSRNRSVGVEIGRGRPLDGILAGMRVVAEGVATTRAAVALARHHRIDMPIARKVHEVLFEGRAPRQAVHDLLARPLRDEG